MTIRFHPRELRPQGTAYGLWVLLVLSVLVVLGAMNWTLYYIWRLGTERPLFNGDRVGGSASWVTRIKRDTRTDQFSCICIVQLFAYLLFLLIHIALKPIFLSNF